MQQLPPRSILLAGLPATGKSSFGNWLEAQQGYVHLDFDEEDIMAQRGFGDAQDQFWHHENALPLHGSMLARQQPIVLSWGFAPQFVPLVKELITWGLTPIWFAATAAVAREAALQRGGMDIIFFDRYLAMLDAIQADIRTIFGTSVLRPLRDDGSRMAPDQIWHAIQPFLAAPTQLGDTP